MLCVSLRSTSAKAIEPLAVSSVATPLVAGSSVIAPMAVVEPVVMVGASFVPVTVTVSVVKAVPPSPSLMA